MAPPSPLLRDYQPVRACQSRAMPCDTVPAYPILGKWPLFGAPDWIQRQKFLFCGLRVDTPANSYYRRTGHGNSEFPRSG